MNMSLRMEQWTPPEWQSIIELVADPRTVRKLAEYRLRWNVRALRDRIFLLLPRIVELIAPGLLEM